MREGSHLHVPQDAVGRRGLIALAGMLLLSAAAFFTAGSPAAGQPVLLGGLYLASGIIELSDAVYTRQTRRGWRIGLAGVLPCLLAIFLLFQLGIGHGMIVLAVGWFFIAAGLFHVVVAGLEQYLQWIWDVAYGVVALALGAFVLARGPELSASLLMVLVGVELLLRGALDAGRDYTFRRLSGREYARAAR